MARKFKITEEQREMLLKEGITIQGETDQSGRADVSKTAQAISNSGVDSKKVNVQFPGTSMTGGTNSTTQTVVSEHKLITKSQLMENRLRYLRENSEVMSFDNFIKNLH